MHATDHHEHVLLLASELRIQVCKLRRRLREEAHIADVTPSQASVLSRQNPKHCYEESLIHNKNTV